MQEPSTAVGAGTIIGVGSVGVGLEGMGTLVGVFVALDGCGDGRNDGANVGSTVGMSDGGYGMMGLACSDGLTGSGLDVRASNIYCLIVYLQLACVV